MRTACRRSSIHSSGHGAQALSPYEEADDETGRASGDVEVETFCRLL